MKTSAAAAPGSAHQTPGATPRAGTAGEDHLTGPDRMPLSQGFVLDTHRAGAPEENLGRVGEGAHVQVGPVHDRVQVCPGRREPAAAVQVATRFTVTTECGLPDHEADAWYCRKCGRCLPERAQG